MAANKINTPPKSCAIYKAADLINSSGPRQMCELFASIDFGPEKKRPYKLEHAFDTDWLRMTTGGLIDITEKARAHFTDQEPKKRHNGQAVSPQYRGDWRTGSLSKQSIPNRRGPRADAPAIYGANPTFHRG